MGIELWYFPRGAGGSSLVGGLGFLIGITAPDQQYELWNYTNMAGKRRLLKTIESTLFIICELLESQLDGATKVHLDKSP